MLSERQVWKKVKEQPKNRLHVEKINKLFPEQVANVRIALKVLKIRYGSLQKLAELMHVTLGSLTRVLAAEPNAGLALRIAQVAGVPVDDILAGSISEAWKLSNVWGEKMGPQNDRSRKFISEPPASAAPE